jgi:hypothetical protein
MMPTVPLLQLGKFLTGLMLRVLIELINWNLKLWLLALLPQLDLIVQSNPLPAPVLFAVLSLDRVLLARLA